MPSRIGTISRKLLVGLFLAIVCVVVTTHFVLLNVVVDQSQAQANASLENDAKLVRENLEGQPVTSARLADLAGLADARITVFASNGTPIADSHVDAATISGDQPEVTEAIAHGTGRGDRYDDAVDAELISVAILMEDGRVIRLAVWRDHIAASRESVEMTIYWLAAGTVLLAFIFSVIIARRIGQPLLRFAEVTQAIARGDAPRSQLEAAAQTPELEDLAQSIGVLLVELDGVRDRIRQDSPHLNALLDALSLPVLFVNPVGQVVRTNMAARSELELLYTMRDLDEARLSELREPLADALANESALNVAIRRDQGRRWIAHIQPMTSVAEPLGAVVVLIAPDEQFATLQRQDQRLEAG